MVEQVSLVSLLGNNPRCERADRKAISDSRSHAEALQCWNGDLLQRLHLLLVSRDASDHAPR